MLNYLFSTEEHLVITFIASVLIWLMVGGIVYLWVYQKKILFRQVVSIFIATLFAWILSEVIKSLVPVQRPFMINGQNPLTLTWPLDSSFPSAHASGAFALATSLRRSNRRLFLLYFIFAVIVSVGRVLSRVHYVVDVLVGAVLGISSVILLERLGLEKLFKKMFA